VDYFEYKKSDYQLERSLLQKAVRRGDVELTKVVVKYLLAVGDTDWLKKRLFVIAYEECWPISSELNQNNLITQFSDLAVVVKNKNAAGLASLAVEFNSKNYVPDRALPLRQSSAIKFIAKAIKDPEEFWNWAKNEPRYAAYKNRVEAARKAVGKAGFDFDKAMMYAAAYLTLTEPVPVVQNTQPINDPDFPYWVAIDKHTDRGKEVYMEASKKIGIDYYDAMRIGFYLEGSVCNGIVDSPYWNVLAKWQIEKMGMTYSQAMDYWEKLKPIIIDLTKIDVEKLKMRMQNTTTQPDDKEQLSLF
jgi:hypothetical protein